MSEISDWGSLLATITAFLAFIEAKKANRSNQAFEALREVINSAEMTETYLLSLEAGKEREIATEHKLAEAWSSSAFLISRVDKKLSITLTAKSHFWRNRDTWQTDVRAYRDISLISVRRHANRLMEQYGLP